MTAGRHPHVDHVISALRDAKAAERYTGARLFLQMHLVVTRDIPNGKDFLFSGDAAQIQEALKTLVAIEHRSSPFLEFDYARIEQYYLLRVVGGPEHQDTIGRYFD